MQFEPSLQGLGFHQYRQFDPGLIQFNHAFRDLCKRNTCGHYGKNHMCPPAVKEIDTWKQAIAAFDRALIVTKVYPVKNSFDSQAMRAGLADFQASLNAFNQEVRIEFPEYRFMVFGAGACTVCDPCGYGEGQPCRFPDRALPSLEACGIDVVRLSKSAEINYSNGKNTVTYIGTVLYRLGNG